MVLWILSLEICVLNVITRALLENTPNSQSSKTNGDEKGLWDTLVSGNSNEDYLDKTLRLIHQSLK